IQHDDNIQTTQTIHIYMFKVERFHEATAYLTNFSGMMRLERKKSPSFAARHAKSRRRILPL
ncbi:unnamed protein product, partial [Sphenostylis stenocarpa]